jgi:hypothetical protein
MLSGAKRSRLSARAGPLSAGDGGLIHVSAVGRGYANLVGWIQGLTFYVDGLTDADAHCEKAPMPPCHSIICTRSSRLRKSWPGFCARLNNRRSSPEKPLVFAISLQLPQDTGIKNSSYVAQSAEGGFRLCPCTRSPTKAK